MAGLYTLWLSHKQLHLCWDETHTFIFIFLFKHCFKTIDHFHFSSTGLCYSTWVYHKKSQWNTPGFVVWQNVKKFKAPVHTVCVCRSPLWLNCICFESELNSTKGRIEGLERERERENKERWRAYKPRSSRLKNLEAGEATNFPLAFLPFLPPPAAPLSPTPFSNDPSCIKV